MTNWRIPTACWRDGGGYYAPGTDTPNAPWNQKELEITDDHTEAAEKEIEELLLWEESNDFYEWSDQLQTVMPHEWFKTKRLDLIENIEVVAGEYGMRQALELIDAELKAYIATCTRAWVNERAYEIALDECHG